MSDETTEFDALTMDGGPFDSLRVTRMDDGGIKLSISRDSIVFMQEASGTMCAEDARELAKWLTPDVHEQLAAATQRAQVANQYALGMEEAANAVRAQNAALLREVAGLRYYIAQLERNVTREERAYAAEMASLMFAQHDSDSAQPRE